MTWRNQKNTKSCGKERIEGFTGFPQNQPKALVNFIQITPAPAQYGKNIEFLFICIILINLYFF